MMALFLKKIMLQSRKAKKTEGVHNAPPQYFQLFLDPF
jgi:hypothetical protein